MTRKASNTKAESKSKAKSKRGSATVAKPAVAARKRVTVKSQRPARRPVCDSHGFMAAQPGFMASGKTIAELDLVDYAKAAAEKLLKDHPTVVFNSGRRTVKGQADAMAPNIVKNRKWIEQTYAQSAQRDALQKWVDDHPEAKTAAAISSGLVPIMDKWTDAERATLSRHFSGQAFDVQPVANGDAIKKTIRALPNLRKFLEEEGGLVIWHADFEKA